MCVRLKVRVQGLMSAHTRCVCVCTYMHVCYSEHLCFFHMYVLPYLHVFLHMMCVCMHVMCILCACLYVCVLQRTRANARLHARSMFLFRPQPDPCLLQWANEHKQKTEKKKRGDYEFVCVCMPLQTERK